MTSTAIRFGRIDTITVDNDGITAITTQTIHDFATTNVRHRYTEQVFADTEKQMYAEALKLMDRLKADDVSEIAFSCAKREKGSKYRMEVSWLGK